VTFISPSTSKQTSAKTTLFSLLFLSTLRVSSCEDNPPMVRTYEYTSEKESALRKAQIVFEKLGYKISSYDEVDNYFTTEMRVVNRLFRPIYYVAFVAAHDRLTVAIYSEVRTFMRSSRLAFSAETEQVMQDASNNLSDRFQYVIFNPITESIEENGFARWDRVADSERDDEIIRQAEELRISAMLEIEEKMRQLERIERESSLKEFHEFQDNRRLRAGREVEQHLKFWSTSRPKRSIVELSRTLEREREKFEAVFREVVTTQRDVNGTGMLLWIIGKDGLVVDLRIVIDSSINTPETHLRDRLASILKSISFKSGNSFLKMKQRFSFNGNYNNLKMDFGFPVITAQFDEYPIPFTDVFEGTLFLNQQKEVSSVIIKN
tara:strand:- start:20632 stop:21765 length:1134 start_codon:yes stop_codon:yes gene_type:complete